MVQNLLTSAPTPASQAPNPVNSEGLGPLLILRGAGMGRDSKCEGAEPAKLLPSRAMESPASKEGMKGRRQGSDSQ